jgi:hypothetical protein
MDAEMMKALETDGEKLRQLTGEDHGPEFVPEQPPMPDHLDGGSFEWCIVEIFGHRSHAGRGRQEDRFGSKMLRIDELTIGADGRDIWETFYYGGGSIFSFRPATEELVRKNATRRYAPYRAALQIEDHSDDGDDMFGSDD